MDAGAGCCFGAAVWILWAMRVRVRVPMWINPPSPPVPLCATSASAPPAVPFRPCPPPEYPDPPAALPRR